MGPGSVPGPAQVCWYEEWPRFIVIYYFIEWYNFPEITFLELLDPRINSPIQESVLLYFKEKNPLKKLIKNEFEYTYRLFNVTGLVAHLVVTLRRRSCGHTYITYVCMNMFVHYVSGCFYVHILACHHKIRSETFAMGLDNPVFQYLFVYLIEKNIAFFLYFTTNCNSPDQLRDG